MEYAYARVSAAEQNLARQLEEFKNFGIEDRNVFADKKSGKDFDRTAYCRLIKKLKAGDLLVVKSIDRLGRDYNMIIEEWSRITRKIQADILVLDIPLLDTRAKSDTLVGKFISDIVLQVLSFVAENERANIRARQAEGIAVAKKQGVRFGRPPTVYTTQFAAAAKEFLTGKIRMKDALSRTGMSRPNFYYHLRRYQSIGESGGA